MDHYQQTLENIQGESVLDVATGRGGFLLELAKHLPQFKQGTGIDNNPAHIQTVNENNQDERLTFLAMDGENLNFPNDHFDVVSICNSLHHMPDLNGTLTEMLRVLKPGGTLVIQEMVSDGLSETQKSHRDLHHWWAAVDTQNGINHFPTFSREEIQNILSPLNLSDQTTIELIDLESNPKDPELLSHLEPVFKHYFDQISQLENPGALQQQGEALKERLQTIGLHSATALLITASKAAQ